MSKHTNHDHSMSEGGSRTNSEPPDSESDSEPPDNDSQSVAPEEDQDSQSKVRSTIELVKLVLETGLTLMRLINVL